MKKIISLFLVAVMLISGLFVLTGCEKGGATGEKKNVVQISNVMGKGTFTVSVPKKEDGTPKYQFTTEKPSGARSGTFYLETENSIITFASSGFAYQTATAYKEKYGTDTKATFDGYLEWMKEPKSTIKLSGVEEFEINGRKALRYYSRTGSSGDYKYSGYIYLIASDDIYPGSRIEMTVYYKGDEKPTEAKEFDAETLDIIKSLKVNLNS